MSRSHVINDWILPLPLIAVYFVSGSLAPEQGSSSVSVWFFSGTLARGNPPFEVVTPAWVIITQWLNILATTLLLSHWGKNHTKALLLLYALRVAISVGFFLFTMSTLFFQVISHAEIVFYPTRFNLVLCPKPNPISLSTRCYIIP